MKRPQVRMFVLVFALVAAAVAGGAAAAQPMQISPDAARPPADVADKPKPKPLTNKPVTKKAEPKRPALKKSIEPAAPTAFAP